MIFFLLAIFAMITVVVLNSAPKPTTAVEQQNLLEAHEGLLYFYDAELMAKEISPDPSLRWSHCLMDPHTGCGLLGRGVWYAAGTIAGPPQSLPTPPNWEALFIPEGPEPLFVRVGNMASGNTAVALQRAGYANTGVRGAPGEK